MSPYYSQRRRERLAMTNRWQRYLAVFTVTLLLGISTQNYVQAQPKSGVSYADDLPHITVAVPMGSQEGEVKGGGHDRVLEYVVALWRYIGQREGFELTFIPLTMSEASVALERGDVDVIAATMYSEALNQTAYFSIPYILADGAVFRRHNVAGEVNLAVHTPMSLPVEFSLVDPSRTSTSRDLNELLIDPDSVDMIYTWCAELCARPMLQQLGLADDFIRVHEDVPSFSFRAAVSRRNRELALVINRGLRSIDRNSAKRLWQRHMGDTLVSFTPLIGQFVTPVSDAQQNYLIDNPVETIGLGDDGYPPYSIVGDFYASGFSIELIKIISRRVGFEVRSETYGSFENSLGELKKNSYSIYPHMYQTAERSESLLFTSPIDAASGTVFSRDNFPLESISELDGHRIAVVKGFHDTYLLEQTLKKAEFIYIKGISEALVAVSEGYADAYFGKDLSTVYAINKLGLTNLEARQDSTFDMQLMERMGVSKQRPELADLLEFSLNSLSEVEQAELSRRWTRNRFEVGTDNREMIRDLLIYGSGLSLFVAVVFFYQRRQLSRRRQAQLHLEKALATAELATSEATQSARAKTDFLARMSHEIRTPMNGVLGMAEALSFTRLSDDQKDLLSTLNGSARNLMALLNDVLDFSKMDAGQLKLESIPLNLNTCLQSAIDNFRHKAISADLRLGLRLDPGLASQYQGDPTRLMQVVNNLVSNSIKFTAQGFVEISAQLIAVDEKDHLKHVIRIDVRDSGIGIPEDKLDTLFNPFVQAEGDTTRRFGGSGLGLSICKEIIEVMGGQIQVASIVGRGSLFSIDLTLQAMEAGIEDSSPVELASLFDATPNDVDVSVLKVLVAEDNKVNLKVISGQLARLGIDADTAENGLIAYQMYQQKHYDLVLSDCHMPEMDGFALAAKISEERDGEVPYLIAVTADAQSGAAEKCYAAGFDSYISKPCPAEVLEAKLAEAVRHMAQDSAQLMTPADPSPFVMQEDAAQFPSLPTTSVDEVAQSEFGWIDEAAIDEEDSLVELDDDLAVFAATLSEEGGTQQSISVLEDTTLNAEPSENATASKGQKMISVAALKISDVENLLDRDHVLTLSGDDIEMAKDVMGVYLETNMEDLRDIQQALDDENYPQIKDVAHRIKGGVRYLGAVPLGDLAQHIEGLALQRQSAAVIESVAQLCDGLSLLRNEVVEWFEELNGVGVTSCPEQDLEVVQ
ncbi:transporter substrate-binding domain-containing protein [Corallincola spongiicola]|uniref:histidine kinase n=2 Tax=Corallincola spongiicola TaxID=2520508 RepID=A0ABY1WUB9_9GAMM|nr:transporter substrate-binding domain-containing protein [Corallincola spongiicola]